VTLFFAGLNRGDEWPHLLPALNAVANQVGSRLKFHVINDRAFYEAIEGENKIFTPLCDYETYQALLSRSEISFMPLRETSFNRCKSDLKFIEAAAHRVTALASPTVYASSIANGSTGLIFHGPDDLKHYLYQLVTAPSLGQSIADNARRYVIGNRMLAYQISERLHWYRSLWARRKELTDALLARVPELA